MKHFKTIMTALLTPLVCLSATGEVRMRETSRPVSDVVMKAKTVDFESLRKRYPAITPKHCPISWSKAKPMKSARRAPQRVSSVSVTDPTPIMANIVYDGEWPQGTAPAAVYEMITQSPLAKNVMYYEQNGYMNSCGGGAFIDGKFYYVYYSVAFGMPYPYRFVYDIATGKYDTYKVDTDISEVATCVDFDDSTGMAYGFYYNDDASAIEFAKFDYKNWTKTVIGGTKRDYMVVAVDKNGEVYGIDSNGTLLKINKTNGAETVVGETGLTPEYNQSATMDKRTGQIYWSYLNEKHSALYRVDSKTGQATKLYDHPELLQASVMYIPQTADYDKSPGQVSGLTVANDPADPYSATVKFTVPDKTSDGKGGVMGNLNWTVKIGDKVYATGTAAPGTEVEAICKNLPLGMSTFSVCASNMMGSGPIAKAAIWTGDGVPAQPEEFYLWMDGDKANLQWKAPGAASNITGDIEADKLAYRIVRYPEMEVVAELHKGTTFSEVIDTTYRKSVFYDVWAVNGQSMGEKMRSNRTVVGKRVTPPYNWSFPPEEGFDTYTIIDRNRDGEGWELGNGAALCFGSSEEGDDWLIAPPVRFEKGKRYTLEYLAGNYNINFPERIEVKMGQGDNPSDYETVILPPTILRSNYFLSFSHTIEVEETGDYRIGFHGISDPNTLLTLLTDIKISHPMDFAAPGKPTDISLKADAKGELTGDLSFKAPTKTVKDATLTKLEKIEVFRNDSILVKTFDRPAVGESLTFHDTQVPFEGVNTYKIIPYGEAGIGEFSVVSAYFGIDSPSALTNVRMKDHGNGHATVTCDPVKTIGVNGGYVDPEGIEYEFHHSEWNFEDGDYTELGDLAFRSKSPKMEITGDLNEGFPLILRYFVSAVNDKGRSPYSTVSISVGKPYQLPIYDGFKPQRFLFFWEERNSGARWNIKKEDSSSTADTSCLGFVADAAGAQNKLHSGKIDFTGKENPVLLIDYKMIPGEDIVFTVEADPDQKGEGNIVLATFDASKMQGTSEWRKAVVDLSVLKNTKQSVIMFCAKAGKVGASVKVDELNIYDARPVDLEISSVSVSATTAKVSKPVTVDYEIHNPGRSDVPANAYAVEFYVNDRKVGELTETPALEAFVGSKSMQWTYMPMSGDGNNLHIQVKVVYDKDGFADNDIAGTNMALQSNNVPEPTGLAATLSDDEKSVSLSWTEPSTAGVVTSEPMREDFEDKGVFAPWSVGGISADNRKGNFGDWKLYDANGSDTYTYSSNDSYENAGSPMAWQVYNPASYFDMTKKYIFNDVAPRSGEQYLVAFVNRNGAPNDKWLISPRLDGSAQTISFYAKGISRYVKDGEAFEVLASSTDTEPENFTKIGETRRALGGPDWTSVEVELPEGSRHFAIRSVSSGGHALMIDDISYSAAGADLTVTGYNIYRDLVLVGTSKEPKAVLTIEPTQVDHVFTVSARYGDIESPLSNEASVRYSGVESIYDGTTLDDSDIEIYSVSGILLAEGEGVWKRVPEGIYVVRFKDNGKAMKVRKR